MIATIVGAALATLAPMIQLPAHISQPAAAGMFTELPQSDAISSVSSPVTSVVMADNENAPRCRGKLKDAKGSLTGAKEVQCVPGCIYDVIEKTGYTYITSEDPCEKKPEGIGKSVCQAFPCQVLIQKCTFEHDTISCRYLPGSLKGTKADEYFKTFRTGSAKDPLHTDISLAPDITQVAYTAPQNFLYTPDIAPAYYSSSDLSPQSVAPNSIERAINQDDAAGNRAEPTLARSSYLSDVDSLAAQVPKGARGVYADAERRDAPSGSNAFVAGNEASDFTHTEMQTALTPKEPLPTLDDSWTGHTKPFVDDSWAHPSNSGTSPQLYTDTVPATEESLPLSSDEFNRRLTLEQKQDRAGLTPDETQELDTLQKRAEKYGVVGEDQTGQSSSEVEYVRRTDETGVPCDVPGAHTTVCNDARQTCGKYGCFATAKDNHELVEFKDNGYVCSDPPDSAESVDCFKPVGDAALAQKIPERTDGFGRPCGTSEANAAACGSSKEFCSEKGCVAKPDNLVDIQKFKTAGYLCADRRGVTICEKPLDVAETSTSASSAPQASEPLPPGRWEPRRNCSETPAIRQGWAQPIIQCNGWFADYSNPERKI